MDDIKKIIDSLQEEIKNSSEITDKHEAYERLEEIAKTYAGEDKVISSKEIWDSLEIEPEEPHMMSGYRGLDEILEGFRRGQLIVLSAATKSGKTSMCIELTSRLKEEHPMWFPFEEPAKELLRKFKDRGDEPPLFYTPQKLAGNTTAWIEKKIIESKAKYDSRLVFIDHLHFIIPPGSDDVNQRIGKAMRELKQIAVRWNVAIILIAHMRKTQMDKHPDLEDLRDSSFIAQEADTVIIMWRKTKRENGEVVISDDVNVSVQANRRTGKTGNVKMHFRNGKFYEEDWEHQTTDDILDSW